jgi:membrane-bound lytic murein transglycosylase B
VDGDGDGRRDLWGDWADVFASVSNYLLMNGWRSGEPVMAPADASGANLDGLSADKLALSETVRSLRDRGVMFETSLPPDAPAVLVPLVVDGGLEYRVGFANYHAITRYNRSELYAAAVHDLAGAIAASTAPEALATDASTPAPVADPSPPRRAVASFESGPAPAPTTAPEPTSDTPQ